MALLTACTATIAGKAAVAMTGVAVIGGGLALAADVTASTPSEAAMEAKPEGEAAGRAGEAAQPAGHTGEHRETVGSTDADPSDRVRAAAVEMPEGEGARSRSGEVHEALTGDDTTPGEGFGQAVADHAGTGGKEFGASVAAAARAGAGEEARAERSEPPVAQAEKGLGAAEQAPSAPAAPAVPAKPTAPVDQPAHTLDVAAEQPGVELPPEADVATERPGR